MENLQGPMNTGVDGFSREFLSHIYPTTFAQQRAAAVKSPAVFGKICDILLEHKFKPDQDLNMIRRETGCSFSFESLNEYTSVVDFQMDWSYA